MSNSKQEIELKVRQENVKVEQLQIVNNSYGYYQINEPYTIEATAVGNDFIPIQISGKGMVPKTYVLERKRYNIGGLITTGTYAAAIASSLIFLDSEVPVEKDSQIGTVGMFGFFSIFSIPKIFQKKANLFKKRYSIPQLDPLPAWEKGMKSLSVDRIDVNVDKGKHKRKIFNNYTDYKSGDPVAEIKSSTDLNIENTFLQNRLNGILRKTGHADTTRKIYSSSFKDGSIVGNIVEVREYYVGNRMMFEIASSWTLTNNVTGAEVTNSKFRKNSFWSYDFSADPEVVRNMINYCLETALYDFLAEPSVAKFLTDEASQLEILYKKWQPIDINRIGYAANNINKAMSATVTVEAENGHGSGFLISPDGYIITNHHVTNGEDPEKLYVYLEEDKKIKATFIRSNPVYDLCLLKIDSTNLPFLKMGKLSEAEDGTEVYAIGTPQHVDLLKTVSAGIISSNRIDKDIKVIQSDVRINLGNSGGPMILKNGDLIGVVNAKFIGTGIEGISFAIPASYIEETLKINLK